LATAQAWAKEMGANILSLTDRSSRVVAVENGGCVLSRQGSGKNSGIEEKAGGRELFGRRRRSR
jgi:hypothetical protein